MLSPDKFADSGTQRYVRTLVIAALAPQGDSVHGMQGLGRCDQQPAQAWPNQMCGILSCTWA